MKQEPPKSPLAATRWRREVWVVLALVGFLALHYADVFGVPFMREDYLFLDFVRGARFTALWAPNDLIAHYYRPWSRELHYWTIEKLFGPSEPPFHVASLALWLVALWLYFRVALRVTSARTAVFSTLAVVCMAAWGAPLLWVAGAQDLWMLVTGLAFLAAFMAGRRWWAAAALAFALLSKEPAAVLPAVAATYAWIIERRTPGQALTRTAGYFAMVAMWATFHPMVGGALLHRGAVAAAADAPATGFSPLWIGAEILSLFNLDAMPDPEGGWVLAVAAALPLAVGFCGVLYLVAHPGVEGSSTRARGVRRGVARDAARGGAPNATHPAVKSVALWGAVWAIFAWVPLLAPGITWQPYYGLLGALGAWLAIAAWIGPRLYPALGVLAVVAVLRSARVATPQSGMGSEWSQRRVGEIARQARQDLLELRPTLPRGSRVFFASVPWGMGFLATHGDAPALRVWYRDSTLRGGFFSSYRPRVPQDSIGRDFFFEFENEFRLIEVVHGEEALIPNLPPSPRWEKDHFDLARLVFQAGDPRAAAVECEKLARVFPNRSDYAYDLGLAHLSMGDTAAAAVWIEKAASLPRAAPAVREAWRELQARLRR